MNNRSNSSIKTIFSIIIYCILIIIGVLILLTVFNMDLFMSYFSNPGSSSDMGAWFARMGDYIIALFQHTFGL